MAAITTAELVETVLNVTDDAGSAQGDMPIFEGEQLVHYLADIPATGSNGEITGRKYKIIALVQYLSTSGGVTKLLDQTRAFATAADGTTARNITGFQHNDTTGAPGSTVGATTTSRSWFYDIQDTSTNEIIRGVHQSQLTDQAGWETYIAAQIANIYS